MYEQHINETTRTAETLDGLAQIAADTDGSTGYSCSYCYRNPDRSVRELTAEEWAEFGDLCEALEDAA